MRVYIIQDEQNDICFVSSNPVETLEELERGGKQVISVTCWYVDEEKQSEQKPAPKFNVGDTMRTLQEANDGYTDGMPVVVSIDNEYYHCTNELISIKDQDDYEFPPINIKQKPANND